MTTTTNNADVSREMLSAMSPNAIRKFARERFGMTMPFSFKRDELIDAVMTQLAPDEPTPEEVFETAENIFAETPNIAAHYENDPEFRETFDAVVNVAKEFSETLPAETVETGPDALSALIERFGGPSNFDLSDAGKLATEFAASASTIMEAAPKPVTEDVPDTSGATAQRTREDVAARLAAHRSRLAAEAAAREVAITQQQKQRKGWEPTSDELNKRAHKLAFAIGSLVSAHARIAKETKILADVLTALGEMAEGEIIESAKQAMIEGYSYAQQRTCFPSSALASTLTGDALREAVWTELVAVGVPVLINTIGEEISTDEQ